MGRPLSQVPGCRPDAAVALGREPFPACALRPRRRPAPMPGSSSAPGSSTPRNAPPSGGPRRRRARISLPAASRPTEQDEDVHTFLERLPHRAAGRARRQAPRRTLAQRPGRQRPQALSARRGAPARRAHPRSADALVGTGRPASRHARARASPICSRRSRSSSRISSWRMPRRSSATSTACATGTGAMPARRSAPRRWRARRSPYIPELSAAELGL